ncbi:conjugative transfer relaxase/helicase TraI [Shewanella baltica]|uniref:conjugative transfer relaxase/helicase TraI n=1 Tax=Shewanella baltica TaxID=62322 RepID=UPI0001DB825E|nr:conjugative transfer relaxase/helicase TraI [Shewanella baltica]ADT96679.1 conjugative transfer relaxase protein TraI [Shewanella baltica OS678]
MLSISPIASSAGGAASYYLSEEKNLNLPDVSLEKAADAKEGETNYYLKEQSAEPNTQWFGKLAEQEGMLGKPVEEHQLKEVLAGSLNDQTLKTQNSNARNGFDFTFSAPKSVSLLALVGGDKRLMTAHDDAVKFALSHIEKDAAQARQTNPDTKATSFENTGNLLFAMVRHKTSREEDPQLHTHSLTANMTKDSEGTLRALASSFKQKGGIINGTGERVYNHQKYYTSLYQSALARSVEQAGYQTRSLGNNLFEVEGVPQSLLDTFSTRSQQINEQTQSLGLDSQAARDVAAKDTRKSKAYTSEATLFEQWKNKANNSGFNLTSFVTDSMSRETSLNALALKPAAIDAVSRAIEHASNTQNRFNYAKLVESATLEFTRGQKLNALDIKLALDKHIEDGALIPLDKESATFTSAAHLKAETNLLESIKPKTANMRQVVDTNTLQGKGLNADNQKKVSELFASTKQVNLVNVFGSSEQLATALLNVGEANGKRIHIITPDMKSKLHTSERVQRDSSTIGKWIMNHFKPDHTHTLSSFTKTANNTNRDILVVENANKLGLNDFNALLAQAKAGNSKVILLNHANAKQGMKAGNAIEVLKKGNVNESNWVATKQSNTAMRLHESKDSDRVNLIAKTYAQLPEKQHTQVIAGTHKDVKQLNSAIRAELQNQGDVSRLGLNIPTLNPVFLSAQQREVVGQYTKGMVLTQWQKVGGRNQQQQLTVDSVNRDNNTLTLVDKQGKSTAIDPSSKAFKAAEYAIAKPDNLHIANGDKLIMATNHQDSGLSKQIYTINALSKEWVTLKDESGKQHSVKASALHHAPLNHGYATTPSNASPNASHHIVNIKAYSASKEWLHDTLTQGIKHIDIFTDKAQQFDDRLEKSEVKPSSISRIMQAADMPEKFVNSQTTALLTQDVTAALNAIGAQHQDKGLIHNAVDFAIQHISEKEAGYSQKELIVNAIKYAFEEKGTSITQHEIINTLQHMATNSTDKGAPSLLSAEYHDGTRWTTQAAIDTELRILDRLQAGKDQLAPLTSVEHAAQVLSQNQNLTDGQKDSTLLITTTKDRFVGVQGLAGTGKSTMLETGIDLVKQSESILNTQPDKTPTQFIGLAPTHAAVNELKDKNVESQTVQSLLSNFLSQDAKPDQYANTVFLLDESSMTSNAQMDKFTHLIETTGARAVFLGDTKQLTSQEAGKPFELALNKGAINSVTMKDIVRQQNSTLLSAVHNIVDRQGESAIDKIQQQLPFDQYTAPTANDAVTPEKQATANINQSLNIISTLQLITDNPKKNQQLATEALPATVALEYLARTPKARENTLIIAYTNKERDDITHEIRQGLQQQKSLSTEQFTVPRLRGVHASKAELATMLPYQQGLILTTSKDSYFEIMKVDKLNNMLTLADMKTGEEKHFFPKNHGHKFTNLWAKSEQPLAEGDSIMLRKSDIDREMQGNKTYTVSSIDDKQMQLKSTDNHTLTLSTKDLKDAHWDYAYTRTADMAQGATYENVITAIKGQGALTNVRRAYIDITRASKHVKIITDNPQKMMLSWVNNDPNKVSALETRDKYYPEHTPLFNDKPLPQENPKYLDVNGYVDLKRMATELNAKLPAYSESLATQLLGEPNHDKSDKDNLTFGKEGSLTLTTTGQYRGYFKDWKTGDKGTLINLIMVAEKCSYKDALYKADKMMNEPDKYNLVKNPQHDELTHAIPVKQSQLEARAKQYFNEAKPIENSLAQTYLNKQDIDVKQHENLRFHDAVYSSEKRGTFPALIANITNDKDETKAVEITYLDKSSGDIAALKINKRILGSKSGNSTTINKGNNSDYSIVAVGVENALKINANNKNGADVIALNNNNDTKTFNTNELRENVIVVLDTNNSQDTAKLANDLTEKFSKENIHAVIIEPNLIPDGLNKVETTKQLVNEAIYNITTKDNTLSKAIQSLSHDIAGTKNITMKDDSTNVTTNKIKHDEHYQHLAMDSHRSTTKEYSPNIDNPKLDIGEKTM